MKYPYYFPKQWHCFTFLPTVYKGSVSPHPPQPYQLLFFTPHVIQYSSFFFFLIYLAVLGLEAHRILIPGLVIALTCPALQGGFSTTGPPGSPSLFFFFNDISHSDRYELIPH